MEKLKFIDLIINRFINIVQLKKVNTVKKQFIALDRIYHLYNWIAVILLRNMCQSFIFLGIVFWLRASFNLPEQYVSIIQATGVSIISAVMIANYLIRCSEINTYTKSKLSWYKKPGIIFATLMYILLSYNISVAYRYIIESTKIFRNISFIIILLTYLVIAIYDILLHLYISHKVKKNRLSVKIANPSEALVKIKNHTYQMDLILHPPLLFKNGNVYIVQEDSGIHTFRNVNVVMIENYIFKYSNKKWNRTTIKANRKFD